jgi:hypothetical protein
VKTIRVGLVMAVLGWLASGCGGNVVESPLADACAKAVETYRSPNASVRVVGRPTETSEGHVDIEYEVSGATPTRGKASCDFAVGGYDTLTLVSATVDGTTFLPDDLEKANRALAVRNAE